MDWEKVQPALDACREAGVGIINVDTVVKDRDSVISIIETDNYQAGQLCALDMMKRKDEAKIVILDNPIQTSITNREQGFLDTIADNHNYQVVYREAAAGEIEVSSHVMADLLRRGREFASQTFDYFETYTVIALVYLIITLLLSKGVSMMEGRLTYYDRDRK